MSATHEPELGVSLLDQEGAGWTLPAGAGARCRRLGLSVIACCRAMSLDRRLAAGESPVGGTLAVRARMITELRGRRRLADGLARVVHDAERPVSGACAAAPPDRREVQAARIVIGALVVRLRRPEEPVRPQGAALLGLLLSDAASPLYRMTEPGALGSHLRAVAAALEPSDPIGPPA